MDEFIARIPKAGVIAGIYIKVIIDVHRQRFHLFLFEVLLPLMMGNIQKANNSNTNAKRIIPVSALSPVNGSISPCKNTRIITRSTSAGTPAPALVLLIYSFSVFENCYTVVIEYKDVDKEVGANST